MENNETLYQKPPSETAPEKDVANVDSVLLYGLPFILSTDAKETSDDALVTRLGFDHVKGIIYLSAE